MDLYSDEFDKRIDRTLKIILLGDADSRKAEIFRAFMNRQEQELEGGGSVGVDCYIRDIEHKGKVIRLQVWDTSGLERFRSVTASYYRESNGILLVFNSEKQETFNSLDDWLEEIEEQTPRDVVTFLVGTVSNLDSLDRVSREVAELYVKKHNACLKQYFECNPDDTKIVERIFHNLVTTYIQTSTRDTLPKGSGLAVRGRPHSRTPSPVQSDTSRTLARCSKC